VSLRYCELSLLQVALYFVGVLIGDYGYLYSKHNPSLITVTDLGKDAEWKSQFEDTSPWVPSVIHFIKFFVAKTQFYQFWKPLLSRAQEYPDMKDWLDQHEDRMSTKELWNIDSS